MREKQDQQTKEKMFDSSDQSACSQEKERRQREEQIKREVQRQLVEAWKKEKRDAALQKENRNRREDEERFQRAQAVKAEQEKKRELVAVYKAKKQVI